jgi:poly-gamma-glutamate synthesis protein (capsule biosynthesis protein)
MITVLALLIALVTWIVPSLAEAPEGVFWLPRSETEEPAVRILFGGDLMFDRTVRRAMQERGDDHVLSCLSDVLHAADLVVTNLEGPITSNDSKSLGSEVGSPDNFTFTFPTTTASLLKRHNISLVSLANNHATNFGREGIIETREWLDAAGVTYFGDPYEPDSIARVDVEGIPLSFIGWSDWTGPTEEETLAQIRHEGKSGRRPIVVAHWGDEYATTSDRQRARAHAFADAGALLVIGAHPHVIQENEVYNNVPIYYSLGNLVFDQYWNDAVRTGLLVRVSLDARGISSIDTMETYLESDRRTCLKEVEI